VIPTFTTRKAGTLKWIWLILFVEVILGTWSREQVDALKAFGTLVSKDMGIPIGGMSVYPEILNVMAMDGLFAIHRYLPVLILLYTGYQYIQSRRFDDNHIPWQWLSLLAFAQIGLGVLHIWLVVPAWVQVGHVLLGSAILTYSFLLMLSISKTNEKYI
jgi:heme A synthase